MTLAQAATLPALNSQERRIAEAGYRLWLSTVVESVTSFSFPARNRFFWLGRSTTQQRESTTDNISSRQ
jgi:hypothetical protein